MDVERRCIECISGDTEARASRAQARAENVSDTAAVDALSQTLATTKIMDVSDSPTPPVAEARRVAPDGSAYTQAEFLEFFGGLTEWEAATASAAAVGSARRKPAPAPAPPLQATATSVAAPPVFAPSAASLPAPSTLCVGNLSKGKAGSGPTPPGFVDVRVDRQTALGNPFPMGADGHDESFRDAVCDACEELLTDPKGADVAAIAKRHGLRVDSRFAATRDADPQTSLEEAMQGLEARLRAGESLRLLCWCHPKRCHGDGIAQALKRRVGGAVVSIVRHPSTAAPQLAASAAHRASGGGRGGGGPGGSSGGRGRGRGSRSRVQHAAVGF